MRRPLPATILLTGASGFLGKAVLGTLLERIEDSQRILVLLRAADPAAAERRLSEEILAADGLAGAPAERAKALLAAGRLRAVAGDLESGRLELRDDDGWGTVETVIHCAASVSFESPLDEILALNALGPLRLLESLQGAGAEPHFVHVSTAYAADCRHPVVSEDGPSHSGLAELEPAATLELAREWRAAVEEESRGPARRREFAHEGRRDAAHRAELDPQQRAEQLRVRWVTQQLARRGRRHAIAAGWPDTYSLTKALGERLLRERAPRATIVRPTIIESALQRPRPGWLEGIKVADPLILAYAARGLTHLPGRAENKIDIVPVDLVANACLAAAAYPPAERARAIAIASGSRNPLTLGELAAQVRTFFGQHPLRRADGAPITFGELRFASRTVAVRRAVRRELAARAAARLAATPAVPMRLEKTLRRNARLAAQVTRMVKIYGPYTVLDCAFDDANARALAAEMSAQDRAELPFDTAAVSWDDYLQGTHFPQLSEMATARGRAS